MRKSVKICLLLVAVLMLFTASVSATTTDELVEYLSKEHTVAGKKVKISAENKVKLERYFKEYPVSSAEADSIIVKVEEAKKIMDDAGVSDPTKLSQADKDKIIDLANEVADILDVTIEYNSGEVKVYKEGTLIGTVSINQGKLVYTGNSSNTIVAISIVAVVAAAMYIMKKRVMAR